MPPKKPTVLVTDNIHPAALELLKPVATLVNEPKMTPARLLELAPTLDAILVRSASQITAEVIAAAPKLQIIGRAGVGTDNIDVPAATARGIVVVNSPSGNTVAASEHTVAMLLALARRIPLADAAMKAGKWERSKFVGSELFGKTLGVIGLGKIGKRVATIARALEMKVLVYDPFLNEAAARELGVEAVTLDDIWARAEVITLHAPLTTDTRHIINKDTLAKCQDGVRIINCARGELIDGVAVADAVASGKIAGVAIDVFAEEPPSFDTEPLTKLGDKAVLTPHLGASTEEAQRNVAIDVAEQVRNYFEAGFAANAVNLPSLRPELLAPVRGYLPMAEALGALVWQLAKRPAGQAPPRPKILDLLGAGNLHEHDLTPLRLATLKGLLSPLRESVTYVNAPLVAEETGLQVTTANRAEAETFTNLLRVTLTLDDGSQVSAAGTLIGEGNFRFVEVNGFQSFIDPTRYLLFAPHHDRPGMIAGLSTLLGRDGINISALQVGRRERGTVGGESMMIFNLDAPVSDATMNEMRAMEGVYDTRFAALS